MMRKREVKNLFPDLDLQVNIFVDHNICLVIVLHRDLDNREKPEVR